MASYSIGVTNNRFELFDLGDEDPLELIRKQELEREAKKKAKFSEKEKEAAKPKPPAPKVKVEKKPLKDDKGEHKDSHKIHKDEPPRATPRDDRKPNTDSRPLRNNYRGGDDRERENYRSREDQDRGGRDRDGGDDGFRRGGEFRGRGGGRGRGGDGGGPGFRGRTFQRGGGGRSYPQGEFKGKREFDRQSGSNRTGIKPMEKREGSGGYNWGNPKDDWQQTREEELNNSNDKENWDTTNNEPAADTWTGPPGQPDINQFNPDQDNNNPNNKPGSQSGDTPVNPEHPDIIIGGDPPKEELTLDEWKAKKQPRQTPTYNIRKPGEGEDQTQWKKMYALRKKKDGEEEEEEEYEFIDCPQRVGRQKYILDIDIRYKDSRNSAPGGRGRGRGRGGFRGGVDRGDRGDRGERGDRGDRDRGDRPPREAANPSAKDIPKVDDEHDFPSLS